jgi:hypothetical protein
MCPYVGLLKSNSTTSGLRREGRSLSMVSHSLSKRLRGSLDTEMSNETRQIVDAIRQDVGIPPPPAPDMMDNDAPAAGDDVWVDVDEHMEPESLAHAVEAAVVDPK